MGAAAGQRGSALIRRQFDEERRPVEFELMDRFNAVPKLSDAGTPFTDARIGAGNNGFWIYCPKTGFGYWYKTMENIMRNWRIHIVGHENGEWIAEKQK